MSPMSGTFGYELDLNRLTEAECGEVRAQIERFKRWADLIGSGAYFRLVPARRGKRFHRLAICFRRPA